MLSCDAVITKADLCFCDGDFVLVASEIAGAFILS